jgi:hypothetical protein
MKKRLSEITAIADINGFDVVSITDIDDKLITVRLKPQKHKKFIGGFGLECVGRELKARLVGIDCENELTVLFMLEGGSQ